MDFSSGNVLYVDKVLGKNIEKSKIFDPKRPFSSISDALKIAEKLDDAVLIKVGAGIFYEGILEIGNNITIKGSGKLATQIYGIVSTRKLKGSACIRNCTLIGVGHPVLTALQGRLNLTKIALKSDKEIGIIGGGSVIINNFETILEGGTSAWSILNGDLELYNGFETITSKLENQFYNIANYPTTIVSGSYEIPDGSYCNFIVTGKSTLINHNDIFWYQIDNRHCDVIFKSSGKKIHIGYGKYNIFGFKSKIHISEFQEPKGNITLRTDKVQNTGQNSTQICVGDITTKNITGSMTMPDSPGTYNYNIISGSGTLTFPPVVGLTVNLGNPFSLSYTAVSAQGYNFYDLDTGVTSNSLDLTTKLIWRISHGGSSKTLTVSQISTPNIEISSTDGYYRVKGGQGQVAVVNRPRVRLGINNLTLSGTLNKVTDNCKNNILLSNLNSI